MTNAVMDIPFVSPPTQCLPAPPSRGERRAIAGAVLGRDWRETGFACGLFLLARVAAAYAETSDYPTSTRADYVIGCMAANGNTRERF